ADVDRQILEPDVNVIALPPGLEGALGGLHGLDGEPLALADLGEDEVYLNAPAAAALLAEPGDELTLHLSGTLKPTPPLRAVVRDDGPGGQQPVAFLPFARAQEWQREPGRINQILIANRGDAGTSVLNSDEVVMHLRGLLVDD